MFRTPLVFIFILIFLTGCVTERWTQKGKTEEESNRDYAECQQQLAPKMRTKPETEYLLPEGPVFEKCMETKGYKLTTQ